MNLCIVFDLDDTLALVGQGCSDKTRESLLKLEQMGVKIAICSGKPAFYLSSFARSLNLESPILMGENGAIIYMGKDLPPKKQYRLPCSEKALSKIHSLKQELMQSSIAIWYQPNDVGLTCFFHDELGKKSLRSFFLNKIQEEDELVVYEHVDSFDITPKGVDKQHSVAYLKQILELDEKHVICVGNGKNDYPMFKETLYSIVIGQHDKEVALYHVANIDEAFCRIDELIKNVSF